MYKGTFEELEYRDTFEENMPWFYQDECGEWRMFAENPSEKCTLTSRDIERNYCRNWNGFMLYRLDNCIYRLDFSEMKQINLTTGKQREIKRARHSTAAHSSLHSKPTHPVPSHWEKDLPFQLIPLDSSTKECKEVVKMFAETMPNVPIRSIMRIQNFKLWDSFCRKKAQLTQIKQMPIDERMLFHGTAYKNIWSICAANFDLKFAGRHGSVHGKGIYFARHASYANKFCGVPKSQNSVLPSKTMILARVLVGEYTQGERSLCQVPSKDKTMTSFYDSCIDDFNYPKTFVIFNSNQIYPEYLIEF
ncbi:protein mono-ADP-ribosyltransferase PARP11-like isoform X1 [Anguilla anguilla]|uniref:protein mono-ADP-ribosyltransferase PARP11-like isoform X1 n=1 Tax=Anguilla anguilla TaxID=7936 RepID=UPI0015A7C206|nr:protein mono-ADP-ribosyltransferase PARP11-like isoform X1 [Anguilla anguilla]